MKLCFVSSAIDWTGWLRQRRLFRKLLITLLPAVMASYSPIEAASTHIAAISSSEEGFHFVLTIEPEDLTWFTGSDSLLNAYASVTVGIPYGSRATVTSAERRRGEPVASMVAQPDEISRHSLAPVEISKPLTIRGRQVINVRVFPISQRTLYREVEINIAFAGAMPAARDTSEDPVFERMFAAIMANYEQFVNWPALSRPASKLTAAVTGPFYGAEDWYMIPVTQTGLYRISGSQLSQAGLDLGGLVSGDIKMYNGGGQPLDVTIDASWEPPELDEIAIFVEDRGDGVFSSGDYVLFFGEAQDRWQYSADRGAEYLDHPYSDRNVYWLHVSDDAPGLRWSTVPASSPGTVVDTFTRFVRVEQDNLIFKNLDNTTTDYFRWYWSRDDRVSFFAFAPGLVQGSTAGLTVAALTAFPYVDATVNGVSASSVAVSPSLCTFSSNSLVEGSNDIELQLYPTASAAAHLDYFEMSYTSWAAPTDDKLDLTLGAGEGPVTVEVINEFSSTPLVVDVSDPFRPELVNAVAVTDDMLSFNTARDSTVFSRFYLAPVGAAFAPPTITRVDPFDLYYAREQADLIIVTPEMFLDAVRSYAEYRRTTGYTVKVTSLENIIYNFSWGLYDPLAIRNYLKYAFESYPSPPPAAVLFVGDATYDFLDNLSTGTANYVPPCIHALDQSASDDNYVYFGNYGILDSDTSYSETDRGVDMITARWPVKSADEIEIMIDKIEHYESAANYGIWRNNITLVADDEYLSDDLSLSDTIHTVQTETLCNQHTPRRFTPQKIYLWEYPLVGRSKPEVNDAIVNAINRGTLIVNYIGHGNPDQWAHEAVLVRATDLPRLGNTGRLPLVFAASCAIGAFDSPSRQSMAEDFLAMASGGSIGVISATRSVYSSANASFNNDVYDVMLSNTSLSICEAMFAAKIARQYTGPTPIPVVNDRRYVFLGGPFVPLAVPRLEVEFTQRPDSLMAMNLATVAGRIVDAQQVAVGGDGVLYVNVYDSDRERSHRVGGGEIEYVVTGPTIYRGSATITDGEFSFEFITPLDISYGGQGAKISVYAQFDDIDGAGIVDSLSVSGTIAEVTDSTGPAIQVGFEGIHDFISGDYIRQDEKLLVTISDPSGVNLTAALGHGITMEIDNESGDLKDLTTLFEGDLDDFTTGSLMYPVSGLAPGSHHFRIKAWDNANNSSVYEFDAEIMASEHLAIRDLLNYPNPMKESTRFSFYLTDRVEKFSLELFTLSGKKIKSFYRHSLEAGYYDDIEWYGRDTDGSRVATEVYIYKATAYPANGGDKVESYGKLVLIN